MPRVAALPGLMALALSGCTPAPDACTYGFLGEPTMPAELQALGLGADMTSLVLKDGDMVMLAFPPQGGRVIFAGARATNLDACGVELGGAVRDKTTMQVRLDTRTVNLRPTGDGWGSSDPTDVSTFSNVPVCPNEWSKTNVYGTPYRLELTVTDRSGRTASQSLDVTPECSDPANAAECLCICMGGYVLGQSCAAAGDGGT